MNTKDDVSSILSHDSGFSTISGASSTSKFSRRSIVAPMRRLIKRLSGVQPEVGPPKTPRMSPSSQLGNQMECSGSRRVSFNGWKRRRPSLINKEVSIEECPQKEHPQSETKQSVLVSPFIDARIVRKSLQPSFHTPFLNKLKSNSNSYPSVQHSNHSLPIKAPIAAPEEINLEATKYEEENKVGVVIFRNALKTKRRNARMKTCV